MGKSTRCSSVARTSGYRCTRRLIGITLRGPMASPTPPWKRTSLSPPRPREKTRTASTMGRHSPITVALALITGRPSVTMAISVVVPPMSAMIAFCCGCSWAAPMTLAAGPERMVSTGRASAVSALIKEPSPFTIINGEWISRSSRIRLTARTSSSI